MRHNMRSLCFLLLLGAALAAAKPSQNASKDQQEEVDFGRYFEENDFQEPDPKLSLLQESMGATSVENLHDIVNRRLRLKAFIETEGKSEVEARARDKASPYALPRIKNLRMYLNSDTLDSGESWEDSSGNNRAAMRDNIRNSSPGAVVTVKNWGAVFKAMRFNRYQGLKIDYPINNVYTIVILDRYWSSARGRTLDGMYNNWLLGKYSGRTGHHPTNGWIWWHWAPSNNEFELSTAQMWRGRYGRHRARYFLNGKQRGGNRCCYTRPYRLAIGYAGRSRQGSDADVATILYWDVKLNEDELHHVHGFLNEKFSIWVPPFVKPNVVPPFDLTGEKGVQGNPGMRGNDGANGERGPTGLEGLSGDAGVPGAPGDAGDMGVRGPDGSEGPMGAQGPRGPPGEQGIQGAKGDDGDDGKTGPRGVTGNPGIAGPKGVPGDDGVMGPRGNTGPQGDDGPKGEKGPQGDNGVIGEMGDQGRVGDKGNPGEDGRYEKGMHILQTLKPRIDKTHESYKLLDRVLKRLENKDRWMDLVHPPRPDAAINLALNRNMNMGRKSMLDWGEEGGVEGPPTSVEEGSVEIPVSPLPGEVEEPPSLQKQMEQKVHEDKVQAHQEAVDDVGCPPGQEAVTGADGCPPGQEMEGEEPAEGEEAANEAPAPEGPAPAQPPAV